MIVNESDGVIEKKYISLKSVSLEPSD
jgi:hypothetical protein